MPYSEPQAQAHAMDIVKTGIQSNVIHLKGNTNRTDDAETYAASDAKYIAKLLKDLTEALQK
jgi:hypothetical protein